MCRAVFPENPETAERLLDEMADFGERLIGVADRIYEFGIPQEVIDRAMQNASAIAKSVIGARG